MNFKRIGAGVAAGATMLAGMTLGVGSAIAEDSTPTWNPAAGTITIKGDVAKRTFTAYQLGKYSNAATVDGKLTVDFDVTAAQNTLVANAAKTADITVPQSYTNNALAYIVSLDVTQNGAQLRAFAEALKSSLNGTQGDATATVSGNTATFTGLESGYYVVIDSNGTPMLVGTTIQEGETKHVQLNGHDLAIAYAKPYDATKPTKDSSLTSGSIGTEVPYTITYIIPGSAANDDYTNLVMTDIASAGLTMPDTFEIDIDGVDYSDKVTITSSPYTKVDEGMEAYLGGTKTVFDFGDVKALSGQTVTISYKATINSYAVDEVNNSISIADPSTGDVVTAGSTVKTTGITFTKVNADDTKNLAGAWFELVNAPADYNGLTPIVDEDGNKHFVAQSNENGVVNFPGLANGTYTIKEVKAPNGYLQQVKPQFTVKVDGAKENADEKTSFTQDVTWQLVDTTNKKVKNVTAVTQLPMTGAAGITMLLAVSGLLGGAAAVFAARNKSLKRQLNA
ncbi:MAG: SpaA isopeptide-forming pilin-related protein [Bifidobacterium sp.]|nr:SpaA isopeptide-forming pilin-related protein [Bifidobacterium sp.]